METPVAPIGWPLAFNPPDGLTGSLPSFWVQPSLIARAPCPRGVRPIASYSISSAIVKQSWVSTKDRSESSTPADCSARCQATVQPSNCRMSRLDIGRKSWAFAVARLFTALPMGVRGRPDVDGLSHGFRVFVTAQYQGGHSLRHQRKSGALQGPSHKRILLA